ncbi:peptidylprolyl isomerase [Falsihalocynthiibacter sp. S25ZX9]|uniref:peptidylprolyl isomerase n=1 Tax=Falsihalocynthiibacter sp. S25ZX9 TaxID=3240870 RepID=UPI0035107E25
MRNNDMIAAGLGILGVAVFGAWFMMDQTANAQTALAEDGPGPNLVIEVAGGTEGQIVIDLLSEVAPKHVERIVTLANEGAYDNVAFHRVIDGFMAQTGDVENAKMDGDLNLAGTGGSVYEDLKAEFSAETFNRGAVGMARSQSPDSANSQFFIMFAPAPHLDGQYTVVGHVIAGMDVVDAIKLGTGQGGSVSDPDYMSTVTVVE